MGIYFESLYERLKTLLMACDAFASDTALRALFADPRLCAWQRELPYSRSCERRVAGTIRYLHNLYNDEHENGLVILLRVLDERIVATADFPSHLSEMAARVARALRKDSDRQLNRALYGLDFAPTLAYAGEVIAGTGDVALNYIDVLRPGESYYLTVIGDSMEYENIFEGDRIVMRAFKPGEWPGEGDLIVTKYLPCGAESEFGDDAVRAEMQGPTLKYLHCAANGEYHLGWRKDNVAWLSASWKRLTASGNPKMIVTHRIDPIGKVIDLDRSHRRVWDTATIQSPWLILGGEA